MGFAGYRVIRQCLPIDSAWPPSVSCGMRLTDAGCIGRMPAKLRGLPKFCALQPNCTWRPLDFPARFARHSALTPRRIS